MSLSRVQQPGLPHQPNYMPSGLPLSFGGHCQSNFNVAGQAGAPPLSQFSFASSAPGSHGMPPQFQMAHPNFSSGAIKRKHLFGMQANTTFSNVQLEQTYDYIKKHFPMFQDNDIHKLLSEVKEIQAKGIDQSPDKAVNRSEGNSDDKMNSSAEKSISFNSASKLKANQFVRQEIMNRHIAQFQKTAVENQSKQIQRFAPKAKKESDQQQEVQPRARVNKKRNQAQFIRTANQGLSNGQSSAQANVAGEERKASEHQMSTDVTSASINHQQNNLARSNQNLTASGSSTSNQMTQSAEANSQEMECDSAPPRAQSSKSATVIHVGGNQIENQPTETQKMDELKRQFIDSILSSLPPMPEGRAHDLREKVKTDVNIFEQERKKIEESFKPKQSVDLAQVEELQSKNVKLQEMLNQESRNNEILKYGVKSLNTKFRDLQAANAQQKRVIDDNNYQMMMLRERAASADGKLKELEMAKHKLSQYEQLIMRFKFENDFSIQFRPGHSHDHHGPDPRGGGVC